MNEIDYGTDLLKHYVRKNCWLPACDKRNTEIRRHKLKYPTKYFSFCASEAIDVFMLARAGVLQRSADTGRLHGVYFCEVNDESFATIADLIGSAEQGFLGNFQEIVLFEEPLAVDINQPQIVDRAERGQNGTYVGEEDEEPESTPEQRRQIRIKDANERLRKAFPFDIINLDVFGALFPPSSANVSLGTPLLKSIMKMLLWQTEAIGADNRPVNKFTMLLTTHISPRQTDAAATAQLQARLQQNIDTFPNFREPFEATFHHTDATKLSREDFARFFCVSFPKYIVEKAVHDLKWSVNFGPVYLYDRNDVHVEGGTYQMMHAVFEFSRLPDSSNVLHNPCIAEYVRAIQEVAEEEIKYVRLEELAEESAGLRTDLQEIARYRDEANHQ